MCQILCEEHPRDISRPTEAGGSQGGWTWQTLGLAGLELTWPAALPTSPGVGVHLSSQHRNGKQQLGRPGKGLTCQERLHAEPSK